MGTTVRAALLHARRTLRAAGVESASLDAELLLAHALGTNRSRLLAGLDDPLSPEPADAFFDLVRRRAAREPAAYILGYREFWGRRFEVRPGVLIPRPETEVLVERALALSRSGAVVADVGTGSGCIAVSVALDARGTRVYASDTSDAALEIAKRNAARLGARVHLSRGNLLAPLPERAQLVLANLPYVPSGEIADLEPEVRDWEPHEALDGGPDGLDAIRALLAQLPHHATPSAACLLELDPRQYAALEGEVRRTLPGWSIRLMPDLSGRIRVAELAI